MQWEFLDRMTAAERADFIRKTYQVGQRTKGFQFNLPQGQSNQSLNLSGLAKVFLGFAFYIETATDLNAINCQLVINESVVVESTAANFFVVQGTNQPRNYYEFMRGLNSQDTITLTFVNSGAATITLDVVVYYI